MFTWVKTLFSRKRSLPDQVGAEPLSDATREVVRLPNQYSSDLPISFKDEDRFNRWHFANRIADTLATRGDPASLVVGLYGPWGDGKTSTLQLMVNALGEYPQVVVVRFNPWYFQSEKSLLAGFFEALAESLGKSLPNLKETIGQILKKYGSILSLASVSIGGLVTINAKDASQGLGETLSTVELDDLRRRLEEILENSGKKVVVLIDDIDRLDKTETHALLKLVKLSAGFKHTRYVLSFDDEMVAAAIGERYGSGNYEAGRSFLEKIVQVPLHLPPADTLALRRMTLEGVQTVLDQSGIALTQEQADAFGRHFVDGLELGLDTPRRGKVYVNALAFALPLMKGEVNPVDLMLVEGIRVFYPKLYLGIRDNAQLFLKAEAGGQQADAVRQQRISEIIALGLKGKSDREIDVIRRGLLDVLFPRIGNMGYDHQWDQIWIRAQRICSDQYFKRYFSYGVPPGDVSDLEVAQFLENFAGKSNHDQDADLRGFAERNAYPQIVRKLREREDQIAHATARVLAVALSRNGVLAPKERGTLFVTTYMQTAILISRLLKQVPPGQERDELAEEVIRLGEPLTFSFECLRWISHNTDRPEADRIVSADCEVRLKSTISDRVQARAFQEPLYLSYGSGTHALYWVWNGHVGGTVVGDHLMARFAQHPNEVDAFLDTFVGEAWGMESGLPSRADFMRESYDAIAKWLDPEVIVANLRIRYGGEIDSPKFHYGADVPIARRIALQFAFIHRNVIAERNQVAQVNAPEPSGETADGK